MRRHSLCLFVLICCSIGIDGQQSDYCRFTSLHTMCRFEDIADKCGKPTLRGLDDKAKQSVIQAHNLLRSLVASGKESRGTPGPQPSATNMQVMIWDDELATVAQRLADQCRFEHDCGDCRRVERFRTGQNLAIEWSSRLLAPNWKQVVQNWYDEVALFPNTSASNYLFDFATGHYSQVIWASTNRVGCGFTQYRDGSRETNLYVCNYGPAGNFINSPAYRAGSPCSRCPSGTACSAVYANLCEPVKNAESAENVIEQPTSKPVIAPSPTPTPIIITPPTTTTKKPAKPATMTTRAPSKPSVTTPSSTVSTVTNLKPVTTTRKPAKPISASFNGTLDDEFVCTIGRGLCQVSYRSVPWTFKSDLASRAVPKYLGSELRPGEVTELVINKQFPVVNPDGVVCIALKLKQKATLFDETAIWRIPPLVLKVQPENTQAVTVPVSPGIDSRWAQVKLSLSRLSTPFRIAFQQAGPSHALGLKSKSVSVEIGLEELHLSHVKCLP